jgi:CheY-like chemotaxis protein
VTKVLVVDDERVLADTLVIILNRAGFNASAVYSGIDAIEAVMSAKPDVIISDVQMPHMNGIDAMIVIRGIVPKCKILLFSGHAETANNLLESARALGHNFEFHAKPIYPPVLIAMLRG